MSFLEEADSRKNIFIDIFMLLSPDKEEARSKVRREEFQQQRCLFMEYELFAYPAQGLKK